MGLVGHFENQKNTPTPGIEPGSQHGECRVIAITLYRMFCEG